MNQNHPHNDQLLAAFINGVNTGANRTDEFPASDKFAASLFNVRDDIRAELQNLQSEEAAQSDWESILGKIEKPPETAPVHPLRNKWMAAAILILAFTGGILLFNWVTGPAMQTYTAESERLSVVLADGTSVMLRPHSSLSQTGAYSWHLQGEAHFEVAPRQDAVFVVETDHGKITVLGTRFNARTWEDETRVFLESGSVQIQAPDASVLQLNPGQTAAVDREGRISEAATADAEPFTGWINNKLTFSNRPFISIVREVEHHFNIQVSIPDELAGQTLPGTILLENSRQTLSDLALVLGYDFDQTGDRSFRFHTNS